MISTGCGEVDNYFATEVNIMIDIVCEGDCEDDLNKD